MKKLTLALVLTLGICFVNETVFAQDSTGNQKFEYAIVKWDGPDKLQYIYPNKFESVRLTQNGLTIPKDAQGEEFCLAAAANKMGKEGWEAVNLDSRRILFRRTVTK